MSSEVKRHAGLDGREYVALDDYAALEAECERLRNKWTEAEPAGADVRGRIVAAYGAGKWLAEFDALVAERDALRTQLEAIRAAGGEVEVLATVSMGGVEYGIGGAELGDIDIQPDMKALCALQQSLVTGEDDAHVELIDKAQHQRITAAMAAEVERLQDSKRCLLKLAAHQSTRSRYWIKQCTAAEQERDALRAELAAVKGQEAVAIGHVALGSHTGVVFYSHLPQLPDGAKLYAIPPASPDVEGLVKALELIADTDPDDGTAWFHEVADTTLSTWRQSHP